MSNDIKYLKIFFLSAILIYLSLNISVKLYEMHLNSQLRDCDINQSGFLESAELTKACENWMNKLSRDTARQFAPYTLIPISLLIGATVVCVGKLFNRRTIKSG